MNKAYRRFKKKKKKGHIEKLEPCEKDRGIWVWYWLCYKKFQRNLRNTAKVDIFRDQSWVEAHFNGFLKALHFYANNNTTWTYGYAISQPYM